MDELRFVLKCFVFSAVLLVLTQIKTEGSTIEEQIHASLVNSKVSAFVNKVADGGAKAVKDGYEYSKNYYSNWKDSKTLEPSETEEAISSEIKQKKNAVENQITPETEDADSDLEELVE